MHHPCRQPVVSPLLASLLAVVLGLAAQAAAAEERTLTLDPEKTQITFTLGATLHTVEGSFRLASGTVRFDLESGSASGRVVADATSGDSGSEGRDRDMHAKVLESDEYPDFELVPTGVSGELGADGAGEISLTGDLTVHGATHPVEIPAEISRDGRTLRASGSFTVPYVEWGMHDPSKFVLRVDKTVEVRIEAVGTLAAGTPVASSPVAGAPAQ